MSTSPVIRQSTIAQEGSTTSGSGRYQRSGLVGIPLLAAGYSGCRNLTNDNEATCPAERGKRKKPVAAITLAFVAAAACSDLAAPKNEVLSSSQLLFLSLQTSAPPVGPMSFYVVNSRTTGATLRHADQFNTAFAELTFPPGSVARSGTRDVGSSDSVRATASASSSGYRLVLSPANLEFSSPLPTVKFSASVYGDFSGVAGGSRFATAEEYLANLAVWEEISPGTWRELTSMVDALSTTVSARLDRGGTFSLAAAR